MKKNSNVKESGTSSGLCRVNRQVKNLGNPYVKFKIR